MASTAPSAGPRKTPTTWTSGASANRARPSVEHRAIWTRTPPPPDASHPGHPEGYLEAFAQIYVGALTAIRRHLDGNPMSTDEYDFPTAHDGLRGMQFIYRAVESSQKGAAWVSL